MIVAVFADVHGNLPALELFLKDAGAVDLYISLGDVVNYAPWSNECVDLIDQLDNAVKLKGNHEEYFLQGGYGGKSEVAKAFFDYCINGFDRFDAISSYAETYNLNNYFFTHTIANRIIFADTDVEIDKDTIIAHSHKQYLTKKSGYKLINPGSVGQNRTFINVINYLLWNTESDAFIEKQLIYNPDIVINEMRARNYPDICIDYYENKKRL